MRDDIFALATAPGRAAVAVVRVSGPGSRAILDRLCQRPEPRRAALRSIRHPDGFIIDQALVLWFPGPESFTGEDVFELQLHGGPAVVDGAMSALAALGARMAEPGEFTRRAFEAGRLELSQAEAIADLVDAETDAQRRQALGQLEGRLVRQGEAWREGLLTALSLLEAQIDFPDEDIPETLAQQSREVLRGLKADFVAVLRDNRGERIREGARIALVGAPNAGKSSLLNALSGRDAAIVTDIPGATRDIIEAPLVIHGCKVIVADMAGLREASDVIEQEGVRRARAWAESADLRLWIWDPRQRGADKDVAPLMREGDALVVTKQDLGQEAWTLPKVAVDQQFPVVATSTVQVGGVGALQTFLEEWVKRVLIGADPPAVTRLRHRMILEDAADHLDRALNRPVGAAELAAEDVRLTARALARLTGRLNPDMVLDRIFGSFCIGK